MGSWMERTTTWCLDGYYRLWAFSDRSANDEAIVLVINIMTYFSLCEPMIINQIMRKSTEIIRKAPIQTSFYFVSTQLIQNMKSYLALLVAFCVSAVSAFAPATMLTGVASSRSMITMNASERTYIMVCQLHRE